MSLKISLDCDDTIVAFYSHFISKFGVPKKDSDITKRVLNELKKDKEFWFTQPVINEVKFQVHNYCTSRVIPKEWIKKQLFEINNFPKAPVYQVMGFGLSKYPKLRMAGADVHIDDSIHVFKDLNSRGMPCLLLDAPHNQDWGPIGRIYSLDKEEIEETYNLFKNTVFNYFKELI